MLCATCRQCLDDQDPTHACQRCGGAVLLDGRYALDAPLGRGASGITWQAVRVADNAAVAVKEIPVAGLTSFHPQQRMWREAEMLARLEHPRIPRLLDRFVVQGPRAAFVLVSQQVVGHNLQTEMATRPHGWREVAGIMAELLEVLSYLHRQDPPVIHRDITPANVVRRTEDGALFLVDFNTAWSGAPNAGQPAAGQPTTSMGTPGFMAPEQLAGTAVPATDIYAVACVALALLTRLPMHTLVDQDFRLRWQHAVRVPRAFRNTLHRMLEPSPRRRSGNAAALANTLRQQLAPPPLRLDRRRFRPLALAAGVLALGAGAGAGATWGLMTEAATPPGSGPPVVAHAIGGDGLSQQPTGACQQDRGCVPLEQSAWVQQALAACADTVHAPVTPLPPTPAAQCRARVILNGKCVLTCRVAASAIPMADFAQWTMATAQGIRDLHGAEVSSHRWQRRERVGMSWQWRNPTASLELQTHHLAPPGGAAIPQDMTVTVMAAAVQSIAP